jgi:N-acetylmuramic acid 6-phosphate etherase
MVDVNALACSKLVDRAERIVINLTGRSRESARELLAAADWHVKTAIVMHHLNCDPATARQRLAGNEQSVRRTLAER